VVAGTLSVLCSADQPVPSPSAHYTPPPAAQTGLEPIPLASLTLAQNRRRRSEAAETPKNIRPPNLRESFDRKGGYPAGWLHWSSDRRNPFAVTSTKALSPPNALAITCASGVAARAWPNRSLPADIQVSMAVLLDTYAPTQLFVRGRDVGTARPTYYGVTLARGLELELTRTVKGQATVLATVKSAKYISQKWARLTLQARGEHLRVRVFRCDTSEYLNDAGQWQASPAWAIHRTDKAVTGPGLAGLGRAARYAGPLYLDDFTATVPEAKEEEAAGRSESSPPAQVAAPPRPMPRPVIPRHYRHIRIALLAFKGNPLGTFEDRLLANSVDLVVSYAGSMRHIKAVTPRTPKLLYTNTSNLYLELLTDWLAFADAHRLDREAAFYHVTKSLPFQGDSPSSQPVTWFWQVCRGGPRFTDLTAAARGKGGRVVFGSAGEALYAGYPERFREVNLAMVSSRSAGWSVNLEYARGGGNDKPLRWAAVRVRSDTTGGLRRSGRITFDPPAGWRPTSVGGGARLYFVRFRTARGGRPPVAAAVLSRDYVGARGGTSGTVPAFDFKADANRDGYLDDAEYARRAPGKDARFVYESRVLTQQYGQMRFSTNPGAPAFRKWAVRHTTRLLRRNPLADGLFMDNCDGRPPFVTTDVREPVSTYAADSGVMLQQISRAIAPRWVLMNLVENPRADPVVRYLPAYYSEFTIRPLAHSYVQFEYVADTVARRARLVSPPPLAVIDSHPQNGSQTSARMRLATLAYYYLLADPDWTFLTLYGGVEPATPWRRHWVAAAAYDIGRPTGERSVWASGPDPGNPRFAYRVFARRFRRALVLYKPLSTTRGFYDRSSTGKETATRHELHGAYRPLRADGTLGAAVTSVSLRNGEGAILVQSK
jgi:hypothetical protein